MGQRHTADGRRHLRAHEKRLQHDRHARQRQRRPVRPVRPALLRPPGRFGRYACGILPCGRLPARSRHEALRHPHPGQADLPRRVELPACRLQLYPCQLRTRLPLSFADREICPQRHRRCRRLPEQPGKSGKRG